MSTSYDDETISSELLDDIETYLDKRIDITDDGPNEAMRLMLRLFTERNEDDDDDNSTT